ncbi:Helicase associated domain protein [Rubripirellula sp.]|nr:Helicase associated domain protein [Rubripirellula sp.]MDB4634110.1 Helicase associated domain protein [Rubripirellula sp.]MDC0288662.1 Helicase associated domain protein [Rubripirellula sp.]
MRQEMTGLLKLKNADALRELLEGLSATQKGPAFEQFLELLYNGNGYNAVRQGGKGDGGADILLYEPNEEEVFCIIQAKNESKPLTLDKTVTELNKFETKASSKYGCDEFEIVSMNGFVKDAKELSRFRINLRDWEYVAGLIESYDPDSKSVPHIRLHAHNQTTFDAVIEGFASGNKVACVQATGTGKSYVIGAVMNKFAAEKKLVLAPSHYILEQQSQVARWLNASTEYKTYQSLPYLENEEINALNPSLIVLDEFHRVGSEKWGNGVKKILDAFPDATVLGTTATPIRHLDSQRDMSDELFDLEAVKLPLVEAIQRKILPSPMYVTSLYTLREEADALIRDLGKSQRSEPEKKSIRKEIDQAVIDWEKTSGVAEILKKYLNDQKCSKFIVFCKDIKHLEELEDEVRKWFRKTGLFQDRESYRVYCGYKKSDANYKRFLAASNDSTAHILLAVDMLNEGIHAPDIDAVLLFRPTTSPRIFYQQIGRCLQVGSRSNPIIFDFVNNFKSIRANDFLGELENATEKEIETRSRFGLNSDYLPELRVLDESKHVLEIFNDIEERVSTWELRFEQLLAYREEYGNCFVPQKNTQNTSLGKWVNVQRNFKKQGRLSREKVRRLEKIGFVWNSVDHAWESRFSELVAYKEKYGTCYIPKKCNENPILTTWVSNLIKNRNKLPRDQIDRLDTIGFVWNRLDMIWEEKFNELVAYKAKFGDCIVPNRHQENPDLGRWVTTQRQMKLARKLSRERISQLDSIGFSWDPFEDAWRKSFSKLMAYKEEFGNCLVPKDYANDPELGTWVNTQRVLKKDGGFKKQRVELLESIGFVWDLREEYWKEQFKKLMAYKAEHGNCLVPRKCEKNPGLGEWVVGQRGRKKRGNLSPEKISQLDSIGFSWDPFEDVWQEKFRELKRYKNDYGHCLVPGKSIENPGLSSWIRTQRRKHAAGKLDPDKQDLLESIGFVWNGKRSN